MTLRFPLGHHLMRLRALTRVHCGESFGDAAVDRPVATDAWHGLPYLPASAVKGVVAGRYGNSRPHDEIRKERRDLFGSPAGERDQGGEKGRLIFGDGEPLAFPLVLGDGRRGWVVVVSTIYRWAAFGQLDAPNLEHVEEGRHHGYEILAGASPPPALGRQVIPVRFGLDIAAVRGWIGAAAEGEPILAAAPKAARALWLRAVEERTLTALEKDKRVRAGSLRTIELVPAGTVFVSLISNVGTSDVHLAGEPVLQLGAWEGTGQGYVRLETWPTGKADGTASPPPAEEQDIRADSTLPALMARVHRAVATVRSNREAPRIRSAIFDLGPRLKMRGLPRTLAFYLAKATAGDAEKSERRSLDQKAFTWLLEQLFPADTAAASHDASLRQRVVQVIQGKETVPADFETTVLWLRRYAETLLPKGAQDV